ncbi:hypothetical protein H8356DRAFT_1343292 [Neocallimastix lanati (nom. inval.)]|nr:hypothetical protein H8356DRAFT_1343292 [Neocallimastix sp. JGI-2020a]
MSCQLDIEVLSIINNDFIKYYKSMCCISDDNSKVYRYTEYKTFFECKIFIILNDKKEILKYENLHNPELFSKYNYIFSGGIFFVVPKFKLKIKESNYFYTTSFSILKIKEQSIYEILLEEIKKKIQTLRAFFYRIDSAKANMKVIPYTPLYTFYDGLLFSDLLSYHQERNKYTNSFIDHL